MLPSAPTIGPSLDPSEIAKGLPWYLSPCWTWLWHKDRSGYGTVFWKGRGQSVHRVMYELVNGPVPLGLELDHLCRNRACFNPQHLEPVTHRENMVRGYGWAGRNNRKTHCPSGHPYDDENTYRTKDGRRCRACHRESALAAYYRKKARPA